MSTSGPNELATDVDRQLSFSNRLLGQAEGVGIGFYTINFARFACADVHIIPEGQRIFNHCLLNLPKWECADENLQFGYSDKHLLRNSGVQLYEYEHLLLGAALGEFFTEDYVAAIFNALADAFEDDDRIKPRLSSFKGFAHATNGLLATSNFPLQVDHRIRLNPYQDHDGGMPHKSDTTEAIPIDKVAAALRMLGELRTGHVKELTFAGGDILGWFSAYIDMFLGLGVTIVNKDGIELHKCSDKPTVIKMIFVPPESSYKDYDPGTIWLRASLNPTITSTKIPPKLTGRIEPPSVFASTFGKAFHILNHTESKAFGNALGAVARIWEDIAADKDSASSTISDANRSDKGTWGMGLIQTWTNWFPELRHLQGRMERALKADKQGAQKLAMDTINKLEPLCGCFICTKPEGPEDCPVNVPACNFCIPSLQETIIMLGLSLSRVTLAPDLYFSRAGLLEMYKAQAMKRLEIRRRKAVGMDRYAIMFGDDWNSSYPKQLQSIVTMFSGSRPTADVAQNLMALSHEGICAYVLQVQRGDRAAARSDDNVIRVLNGHINWKQKTYSRLCIGPVEPPVGIEDGWESLKGDLFERGIYVK